MNPLPHPPPNKCRQAYGVRVFESGVCVHVGLIVCVYFIMREMISLIQYYQISFQGMHQIALFQVKICKSSLPWEGGHPPPTPSPPRALRALGLGRSAPSQLCPPNHLTLATPLVVVEQVVIVVE